MRASPAVASQSTRPCSSVPIPSGRSQRAERVRCSSSRTEQTWQRKSRRPSLRRPLQEKQVLTQRKTAKRPRGTAPSPSLVSRSQNPKASLRGKARGKWRGRWLAGRRSAPARPRGKANRREQSQSCLCLSRSADQSHPVQVNRPNRKQPCCLRQR